MSGIIEVEGIGNIIRGTMAGEPSSDAGSYDAMIEISGSFNIVDQFRGNPANLLDHVIRITDGIFTERNVIGTVKLDNTPAGGTAPIEDLDANTVYQSGGIITFADPSDPLVVVTGSQPFIWTMGDGAQIIDVRCAVGTAPTGDDIVVDVLHDGSSLWSVAGDRPTIAAGTDDSGRTVPDQNQYPINNGDILTVDIAQVGSTVEGSFLTVVARYALL